MGVRGPGCDETAERIFTNDILGLEVGQVRYAPFCDANGKVVGECTVFKTGDDELVAVTGLDSDLDHFTAVVAYRKRFRPSANDRPKWIRRY